jgi:hypothetical protein
MHSRRLAQAKRGDAFEFLLSPLEGEGPRGCPGGEGHSHYDNERPGGMLRRPSLAHPPSEL